MATGQNLNQIKFAGAAPSTDNEAAVRDFQAAVRQCSYILAPVPWLSFLRMT